MSHLGPLRCCIFATRAASSRFTTSGPTRCAGDEDDPVRRLLKTVLMALAFAAAVMLLRDGMAIGLHVPLDPNEGWNAYHAQAAMTGQRFIP